MNKKALIILSVIVILAIIGAISSNSKSNTTENTEYIPTEKDLQVYEAFVTYFNSPENPNNEETPTNLSKEELEKWMKDFNKRVEEFEKQVSERVAKEFSLPVEEVNEIYSKVVSYKIENGETLK